MLSINFVWLSLVMGLANSQLPTIVPPKTTDTWNSILEADGIFPVELDQAVPLQMEKATSDSTLATSIDSTVEQLEELLSSPQRRSQVYANYLATYKGYLDADATDVSKRAEREQIFVSNLVAILRHNLAAKAGKSSWIQGVTSFTHLTDAEFQSRYTGNYNMTQRNSDNDISQYPPTVSQEAPDSFDWRDQNGISPVKFSQGGCGSCYAFGSLSCLESAYARILGKAFYDFSEQEIVDCAKPYGPKGCKGGFPKDVYRYINDKGINTESNYRYKEKEQPCRAPRGRKLYPRITYQVLTSKNEDQLASDIANIGPATVIVSATNWNNYRRGTYEDGDGVFTHGCGNNPYSQDNDNHLVLVVGYTPDYWIIKNSWGPNWGYDGYIKLKRGSNTCGVSDFPDTISNLS